MVPIGAKIVRIIAHRFSMSIFLWCMHATATDPTIGFAPVASVNTDVVKKIALVVSSPLQCVDVKSGGYNGVCV